MAPALELPVLATPRLRLEPLGSEHSAGMYRLWSNPEVCRYAGSAQDWQGRPIPLPAESAADSDRIIEFFARMRAEGRGGRWAMVLQGSEDFVGALGFNAFGPQTELAFHQLPSHWGQGYMTEACRAVIEWAREQGCRALELFVDPGNAASQRLARRLAFEPAGEPREGALRFVRRVEGGSG